MQDVSLQEELETAFYHMGMTNSGELAEVAIHVIKETKLELPRGN